jgi:hypothetical protein
MLPEILRENPVASSLEQLDPAMIAGGNMDLNELTIEIVPEKILAALRALKEQKFERLSTVTDAPDDPEHGAAAPVDPRGIADHSRIGRRNDPQCPPDIGFLHTGIEKQARR